ncbi:uncharacterized protein LOC126709532 [Quercus robur]|uniref:uncharacterized protein LOC126709532 n=1 Tax=Quercus robur TaxID=38942 RepID=UPI002163CA82|nr:uncharacterized protein LOC126709532 [Quercus robur]
MFVAQLPSEDSRPVLKRARVENQPAMSFSKEDKVGTIQLHDNALVVTLKIWGFDVKRVMMDQDSGVEIMYPNLYNELGLKLEIAYDSPLVSFDKKIVIPKGQIRLLVQARLEVIEVNFIIVDAYSPYTVIVAKPWFHTLGAVSSTLHLKVKYLFGDQIKKLVRTQSMARQCLIAAITHQLGVESSTSTERSL